MVLPLESIAFAALFSSRTLPLLARCWESPANKEWREREKAAKLSLSLPKYAVKRQRSLVAFKH